jgi:hypothetical protein
VALAGGDLMPCVVKLFEPDSSSPPVHVDLTARSIELVAVDEATKTNLSNVETNAGFTAASGHKGYGVELQFSQDSIAYQVAISDPLGVYGGATISSLSGTTDGNLDVVLDKLPQTQIAGGSASAAAALTSAALVRDAVVHDGFWDDGEKQAVLSVINALSSVRGATLPPLLAFMRNYEVILRDRGINAGLF